jgi:hypothetical protein
MSGFETIDGVLTSWGQDSAGGGGGSGGISLKDEGAILPNSPYSVLDVTGDGLQVTNVSSTEAKLNLDLSAVVREKFEQEDNLEYSTNADVYQTKLTLQFTPVKSTDFIILAYSEVSMDNAQEQGSIRVVVNSSDIISEVSTLIPFPPSPHNNDEWLEKTIVAPVTLTKNIQHEITIDWKSESVVDTVYIRRTRIIALGV